MNSIALKYIRDSNEKPRGVPTAERVDLTDFDPFPIGVLEKGNGLSYRYKAGELQPWSWRQMLAAMSGEAKEKLLGSNPTLSVVRITCEAVAGLKDHKRCHAASHNGRPYKASAPVPVWVFLITRSDGTRVRFHTSLNNENVEVAKVNRAQAPTNPALPLRDRSERGAYRRLTEGNYDASARSSQTLHGGGDGSAVAAPPGLQKDELDQSDGQRSGWGNDAWSRWQDWNSDSVWGSSLCGNSKEWHEWGWQERGSNSADKQRRFQ